MKKKSTSRRGWIKKSLGLATGLYMGSTKDNFAAETAFHVLKKKKPRAIVAGAGILGCWTAYFLHKQGYEVTVCDPYGAGNPRSSSGGETRLFRYMYGDDEVYFNMAKRARQLWLEEGKKIGTTLFFNTGLLIFSEKENYEYAEKSKTLYERAGVDLQKIDKVNLKQLYPYLNIEDLNHAIYDPDAGYMLAAESCRAIISHLSKHGVKFINDSAEVDEHENGKLQSVVLSDNTKLKADQYVFANGPWMASSFPEIFKNKLNVTRQPVFFFGGPQGFVKSLQKDFPVWMNRDAANKERCYGVFDKTANVLKLAYTQLEELNLDPTYGSRIVEKREIEHARYLMEKRFKFMKDAPLLYTKVCQHTDTPDKHFIMDQHPSAENLWVLGGGSGHSFKHAPSLGENMAGLISGNAKALSRLEINRLANLKKFSKNHK